LHLAAAYGFAGIVKDLLAAGANIEAEGDPAGVHPLHVAADAGKADVLKLLLDHGAKVDARDREERTPLMLACRSGNDEAADGRSSQHENRTFASGQCTARPKRCAATPL
jgi:ankyrin repeat protein